MAAIYNDAVRTTTATFDTEPRAVAEQAGWLKRHGADHPVVVAETTRHVVGWASLSPWSDRRAYAKTVEISVYVHRDFRGRGIGRTLVREVLAAGASRGLHTVLARIAEGNPASLRLHRTAGFEPVGVMREVGFKFGRFLDVALLQRPFSRRSKPPRTTRRRAPGASSARR